MKIDDEDDFLLESFKPSLTKLAHGIDRSHNMVFVEVSISNIEILQVDIEIVRPHLKENHANHQVSPAVISTSE